MLLLSCATALFRQRNGGLDGGFPSLKFAICFCIATWSDGFLSLQFVFVSVLWLRVPMLLPGIGVSTRLWTGMAVSLPAVGDFLVSPSHYCGFPY